MDARFCALDTENFSTDSRNSLTELSELRFEMNPIDQDFSLNCQLRFGKMTYQHEEREYEIGVTRAHLRLSLEGCETTLGSSFGESVLETVIEEEDMEVQASAGISVSGASNTLIGGSAKADAGAGISGVRKNKRSQSKVLLPVVARPNDSWEVQPKTVSGQLGNMIEGTAIPNSRLCVLRRKQGGNRMAVIGEVQVSKNAIKVSAKGGNALGKTLTEWQNKDAIVSQVLKLAIQRESSTTRPAATNATVAISRCEFLSSNATSRRPAK